MISYSEQAIAIFLLYILFAFWSIASYLVSLRVLGRQGRSAILVAASAIVGPAVLALAIWFAMRVLPLRAPGFYVIVCFLLPIVIILSSWRTLSNIFSVAVNTQRSRSVIFSGQNLAIAMAFLGAVAMLVVQLFFLPIHANDPLEYFQLGRLFFETRDPSLYPVLSSDQPYGFVAPWTHPPAYGFLITLAYFIQGTSEVAGAAKFISLWFGVSTAILCGCLVYSYESRLSWRAMIAPFFVLTVPIYFQLIQSAHIDAMRIATFTAAFAFLHLALRSGGNRELFIASAAIGIAATSHSIGIITPLLLFPLAAIVGPKDLWSSGTKIGILSFGFLIVGAPHYIGNIFVFGSPIQDSIPVWELPELRVASFLEISRGLDTLSNRAYHGMLMPFTRTEYFGLLPIISLVVGIFLVSEAIVFSRSRFAAKVHEIRRGGLVVELVILNIIFFGLLFASIVLGSELAIKNARYLLTTSPLIVVLFFVFLAKLEQATKLAPILRNDRERTSDEVRQGQESDMSVRLSAASPTIGRLRKSGLVALVIALGLSQALAAAQASYGNATVYLSFDDDFLSRLVADERSKRDGSSLGDAYVERAARRLVGRDETVLVFRQSSFGFFRVSRFKSHVDPSLLALFTAKDSNVLASELVARGIKWLYLPNYPLPEVENSAFGPLLRNPNLARPVAKLDGWALYEVAETVFRPRASTLVAESEPERLFTRLVPRGDVEARAFVGPGARFTLQADEYVELSRDRGLVRRLAAWDALARQPVRFGLDPVEFQAFDFKIDGHGRILVNAVLSGSGLAELAVEYVLREPRRSFRRSRFIEQALELGDQSRPRVVREVVWSGLLASEPTEIGGWLVPALSPIMMGRVDGARVIFRVRDGDTLRIHRWTATALDYSDSVSDNELTVSALSAGWLFSGVSLSGRLENEFRKIRNAADMSADTGAVAETTSGVPYILLSPRFEFDPVAHAKSAEFDIDQQINRVITRGNLVMAVSAKLFGYGTVTPTLIFLCPEDKLSPRVNLNFLSLFGNQSDLHRSIKKSQLESVYLSEAGILEKEWLVEMPCVPTVARVIFSPRVGVERIREEQIRDFQRAEYIAVGDLDLLLRRERAPDSDRLIKIDRSILE